MKASEQQIGGSHYNSLAIQPDEYIYRNQIGFHEGCIIKYATRWRNKGGQQDLEKIKHFVDLLIQREDEAKARIERKLKVAKKKETKKKKA